MPGSRVYTELSFTKRLLSRFMHPLAIANHLKV
jgi:hypothetical protein